MKKLHITNPAGRDATVRMGALKPADPPKLGLPGKPVNFRRFLAAAESGLHDALRKSHGDDYAEALIAGDPEIDVEDVGRAIVSTDVVYLSGNGEVLHAPPKIVEVILGPDGEEKERRDPKDVEANVADELPVRWSGKKVPRADAARRFVFRRTLQIRHVDGLTFDFLHAMAKELDEEDAMVLVGAGSKGRDPLVFVANGTPFRGFLEGRVDGERYQLLLHLSNMELKRPTE